jgi:hypothetical protein
MSELAVGMLIEMAELGERQSGRGHVKVVGSRAATPRPEPKLSDLGGRGKKIGSTGSVGNPVADRRRVMSAVPKSAHAQIVASDSIPVLDLDAERARHELWRRVALARAEVQLRPTFEARCELADAEAELRRFKKQAMPAICASGGSDAA